jgi:hypothetical protein
VLNKGVKVKVGEGVRREVMIKDRSSMIFEEEGSVQMVNLELA